MDQQLQNLIRQWRANPSDSQIAKRIAAMVSRSAEVKEGDDYILAFNERQAQTIIDALDLFSRILIGQLDEVIEPFRWSSDRDHDALWDAQDLLSNQVKQLIFPGMPPNASLGINNPNTPEKAKIAFDIQQVLRHRLAWDREKEDGEARSFRGVHHDAPHKVSKEPLPQIEGSAPCKCGRSDCKTGW